MTQTEILSLRETHDSTNVLISWGYFNTLPVLKSIQGMYCTQFNALLPVKWHLQLKLKIFTNLQCFIIEK
jgi:hypothetical protein